MTNFQLCLAAKYYYFSSKQIIRGRVHFIKFTNVVNFHSFYVTNCKYKILDVIINVKTKNFKCKQEAPLKWQPWLGKVTTLFIPTFIYQQTVTRCNRVAFRLQLPLTGGLVDGLMNRYCSVETRENWTFGSTRITFQRIKMLRYFVAEFLSHR